MGNRLEWSNWIKSEGLENILKRVNEIEYRQRTSIIERNANSMKKRQLSLGWDGNELNETDMSWLGKLMVTQTANRLSQILENAWKKQTHEQHRDITQKSACQLLEYDTDKYPFKLAMKKVLDRSGRYTIFLANLTYLAEKDQLTLAHKVFCKL